LAVVLVTGAVSTLGAMNKGTLDGKTKAWEEFRKLAAQHGYVVPSAAACHRAVCGKPLPEDTMKQQTQWDTDYSTLSGTPWSRWSATRPKPKNTASLGAHYRLPGRKISTGK
jgi:hypothetical protein